MISNHFEEELDVSASTHQRASPSASNILDALTRVPLPLSPPRAKAPAASGSSRPVGSSPGPYLPSGDASSPEPPAAPSLLDSLLPIGADASSERLLSVVSALAVAFRQLEVSSAAQSAELEAARTAAAAAAVDAAAAARDAAEAAEANGFLRHCVEQLSQQLPVGTALRGKRDVDDDGDRSTAAALLAVPSLALLRGEALSEAVARLSEAEDEVTVYARAAAASDARARDVTAHVGAGIAALRGELDRLVRSAAAEATLTAAKLKQSAEDLRAANARALVAEEGAARATAAAADAARDTVSEAGRAAAAVLGRDAVSARLAGVTQRLEWAEAAIGVLRAELSARDAVIETQSSALLAAHAEIEAERGGATRAFGASAGTSALAAAAVDDMEGVRADALAARADARAARAELAALRNAHADTIAAADEAAVENAILRAQLGNARCVGVGGALPSAPAATTPPRTNAYSAAAAPGAPKKPVRLTARDIGALDMEPLA